MRARLARFASIASAASACCLAGPAQDTSPGAARAEPVMFVEAGRPRLVAFDQDLDGAWHEAGSAFEGTGEQNLLLAQRSLGPGDFHLRATLAIEHQQASAAAFLFGQSFFGFEGAREELFLTGPLFGGFRSLGRTAEHFERGAPIRFEVIRKGGELEFLLDGATVWRGPHAAPVGEIGFAPMRATVRITSFEAEGDVVIPDRPIRVPPRGYRIPFIDLAADADRQVVVDREPGQYLGHPTTVLLEDQKTMIAVYPKGHGRGAIVMKRSVDAGLTWSERLPTPASWATSQEVPTIHRVVDRDGRRRLVLFSGRHPIRMAHSEDDGLSWSELEPIGTFGGVVAMASVERLRNGDYLALFHDDGRFLADGGKRQYPVVFTLYGTTSQDGGLTWSPPRAILSRSDVHLCEPGLCRSPDGAQIALLPRENSRRRNSFVIFSDDEGATWSGLSELPGALTGDRHTARYAPDGRLLITFRDMAHASPTRGDWVAWVGTWDDIRAGREGSYRVRLMDNHRAADCGYPGLELLPDGTFIATTYGHWTEGEPPYVVSVRFRLDELDRLAAPRDGARDR